MVSFVLVFEVADPDDDDSREVFASIDNMREPLFREVESVDALPKPNVKRNVRNNSNCQVRRFAQLCQ